MVAITPNINDTSESIIGEEVWLRIKDDNVIRPYAKLLRTAVNDSVSMLGVASYEVKLGTSVLEVEVLIFKKLDKNCL